MAEGVPPRDVAAKIGDDEDLAFLEDDSVFEHGFLV
jgi:hypothetical protein